MVSVSTTSHGTTFHIFTTLCKKKLQPLNLCPLTVPFPLFVALIPISSSRQSRISTRSVTGCRKTPAPWTELWIELSQRSYNCVQLTTTGLICLHLVRILLKNQACSSQRRKRKVVRNAKQKRKGEQEKGEPSERKK